MIKALFIFLVVMRTLPDYLGSDDLYWVLNDVLMIALTAHVFKFGKKSVVNMGFCVAIIVFFLFEAFDDFWVMANLKESASGFWKYLGLMSSAICAYVLIFRKRYEWKKLNSDEYDPEKVQAIYSKPKSFMTLLGAAISHSPKCSVRYTYGGETIRFKKGSDTPIKQKTVILDTDIIIDTSLDPEYFGKRWAAIKNKRYNLLFFNCKGLLY